MTFTAKSGWPALGRAAYLAAIYLGLPLLGWGVDSPASFFTHPARAAFAGVVFVQALVGAWLVTLTPTPAADTGTRAPRYELARWHAYLFETIVVLGAYGDRRSVLTWNENGALRWLGLGIYVFGAALSAWATFAWARHLRTGAPADGEPALLTAGPFHWVRHPAYLALLLSCIGFVLLLRSWPGLVLLVGLAAAVVHRIGGEEVLLARRFKAAWLERRDSSRRLIPFLY